MSVSSSLIKILKIWVEEMKKIVFNSAVNFRSATHFWLCLLKTQVHNEDWETGNVPQHPCMPGKDAVRHVEKGASWIAGAGKESLLCWRSPEEVDASQKLKSSTRSSHLALIRQSWGKRKIKIICGGMKEEIKKCGLKTWG